VFEQYYLFFAENTFVAGCGVDAQDMKMTYYDLAGKRLFPKTFMLARVFSEGLAAASTQIDPKSQSRVYGYIDRSGNFVIPPKFYVDNSMPEFRHGRAIVSSIDDVSANDSDPPVGIIDRTGRWIVQPKCYRISAYCDGLASARIKGECVYFDLDGNVAIRTKSSYANSFSEGLAAVKEP
jgi:hypothetical protein